MRRRLREVGLLLLLLGAGRILLSIFLYASAADAMDDSAIAVWRLFLGLDLLIGIAMIAASRFVAERPERIAVCVLVGWVILQIFAVLFSPLAFLSGILWKIFITIGLARGVVAARSAEVLRRQLAGGPREASLA